MLLPNFTLTEEQKSSLSRSVITGENNGRVTVFMCSLVAFGSPGSSGVVRGHPGSSGDIHIHPQIHPSYASTTATVLANWIDLTCPSPGRARGSGGSNEPYF